MTSFTNKFETNEKEFRRVCIRFCKEQKNRSKTNFKRASNTQIK